MASFEGVINEIVFRNDSNGYTVLSLKPDKGKAFTVVGMFPLINSGERIYVEGEWTEHRDYGKQLKMVKVDILQPTTKSGIERYLASGVIKGVGPATAKLLVKTFGEQTLDILENHPDRLIEIEGIGSKRARQIADSYQEKRASRMIMVYLAGLGLSPGLSLKIYNRYQDNVKAVIDKDPYRLIEDISGVGFRTADEIALSLGFQKTDEKRLRSGIQFALMDAENNFGHTYLPYNKLMTDAAALLQVPNELIERSISVQIMKGELVTEEENGERIIYLNALYQAEAEVAVRIVKLLKNEENNDYTTKIEKTIEEIKTKQGMTLSEKQKEALFLASQKRVCVITGGPGTGKTTLIQCLIRLFSEEGEIELCAPTGRAAKRMTEATGMEARTIHRLLEYSGSDEYFQRNQDAPLSAKTIIVDEMSMIDIFLMRSLLKAVKAGARLILSGDKDQLPSVGAGNVLDDLIESGVVPIIRLTEIFRQAEKSAIVKNAHRINGGENPIVNEKNTDFFLERTKTSANTITSVLNLTKTRLPNYMNLDCMRDIQVMAPLKKSEYGVYHLNELLQDALNPKGIKAEIKKGETVFRLGDKVMQTKNNYNLEWEKDGETGLGVFNGDIGFITTVETEEKTITVTFDDGRVCDYDQEAMEDIELAYCMSVHKSQGSEFEAVVLVLFSGPPMLMTRNLLYTAVTRAKKLVVIVGREECIRQMVANNRITKRYSALSRRLKELT
ncbi:MAG: ATP-dependent RecD-like DNA helicase [Clostridiales bacterium]|nr:ATP-dependent RecD-like DNA helicase [Clostridiales bacterium]